MAIKFASFKSRGQTPLNKRKFFYSKKTYTNPFFRHSRASLNRPGRPQTGKNRARLFIFAGVILLIVLIWLIFFSNLFKISKIEVSGVDANITAEVETLAGQLAADKLIGKNNLLFFSSSDLEKTLNDKYYLEKLAIKKSWPHTLKITLEQKLQAAVWREADKYYYLDAAGTVITQVDPLNLSRSNYPLIDNQTEVAMAGRQANINAETVGFAINLFNEFKDKKHGFEIENFIVDREVNTVKLSILGGPKIFFNVKADLAEQTAKLDLIIKDKLKDDFLKKTYLDLRYGNNVYIK